MADQGKVIAVLKKCSFFDIFSLEELKIFAVAGQLIKCDKACYVAREHHPGPYFFVVVAGELAVYKGQRLLSELKAGDVFGEISSITDSPRTADVVAKQPSVLFRVGQDVLEAGDCNFQLKLYKTLANVLIERLCRLSDELAY